VILVITKYYAWDQRHQQEKIVVTLEAAAKVGNI